MTPVDWAVGLDTNFTPEDLADSPDAVIMMIEAKASKLDAYKAQLALLQGAVDGDPVALKAAVDAAAQNLDQVESALNSKYMDSTIELAKVIINVSTGGAAFAAAKVAEMTTQLESSVKKLDPAGTVEDIGKQITAVGSRACVLKYRGVTRADTDVYITGWRRSKSSPASHECLCVEVCSTGPR